MILHPPSRPRRFGLGALGQHDRLAGALSRRLDDAHHWLPDVTPGSSEPIDAVLVGPGGTWAITTRGERGRFTRRNGHWYRWNRSTDSWVPWDATPVTATRLAARRLSLYLDRAALPDAVEAVLVPPADMSVEPWAGEPFGLVIERDPDGLAARALGEERLTGPQVDRIVALLDPRQPLPRLAPSTPRS